ncbi:36255_t:CDS:1, partial [Racocetra persica]
RIDNSANKNSDNILTSSQSLNIEVDSSVNNSINILTSSQPLNVEIEEIDNDIQQQKIDKLLEHIIDFFDSILTTFIDIIKKVAKEQLNQPKYLKI